MPKIAYIDRNFTTESSAIIVRANEIIEEYAAQGFDLTLRQLYYQFVARDILPNNDRSYKRLGSIVNDGRLAGLIDWDAIEDRTRNVRVNSHWDSPAAIVETCSEQFQFDKWASQDYRPEVWIEKDALVGILDAVCPDLDVAYFACRGYTSQSEMWRSARRLKSYIRARQTPVVLYLGDHDPSGIDMSRDIQDRLDLFISPGAVEVKRLALNWDQVQEYGPPPNPAKLTDSRIAGYIDRFGTESWELDALDPTTLAELIRGAIADLRDEGEWAAAMERETKAREVLATISRRWPEVEKFAAKKNGKHKR